MSHKNAPTDALEGTADRLQAPKAQEDSGKQARGQPC
jgi:hypothetical protein